MFLMMLEMVSGYSKFPWEVLLKVSSRYNIRNLVKIAPILQVSNWVLDDRDVLDDAGDGVRVLKISLGSSTESFIKIQHQKPSQDCTYPPSLLLESWRTGMFLMELEMV